MRNSDCSVCVLAMRTRCMSFIESSILITIGNRTVLVAAGLRLAAGLADALPAKKEKWINGNRGSVRAECKSVNVTDAR